MKTLKLNVLLDRQGAAVVAKQRRNLAVRLPKETAVAVVLQRRNRRVRLPKEIGQNQGRNCAVRAQIQCLARARFGLLVMMVVKKGFGVGQDWGIKFKPKKMPQNRHVLI